MLSPGSSRAAGAASSILPRPRQSVHSSRLSEKPPGIKMDRHRGSNERVKHKGIRRTASTFYHSCGGDFHSSADDRLLAGVDFPGDIFWLGARDYHLPDEERSEAPGAADQGGAR